MSPKSFVNPTDMAKARKMKVRKLSRKKRMRGIKASKETLKK